MMPVVIKLVSGEEIFTDIIKIIDDDTIVIEHPMKIEKELLKTEDGVVSKLNYEPFMDYGDSQQHILGKEFIIFCEPLNDKLTEMYADMVLKVKQMHFKKKVEKDNKLKVLH